MKHLIYLFISFLIPLSAWAENNATPLSEPGASVQDQFVRCIEAEHGTGNGPITSDPNASNGSARGDENFANHYVDYYVNAVQVAGPHQLKLQYYASGTPQVSITVNGQVVIPSLTLPSTHSWNIVHREETIEISLNAGGNAIRIQCLPGASLRQDKICVTGPAIQQPVCDFNIAPSADKPVYAPRTNIGLYPNCTGSNCNTVTYNWSGNGFAATGGFVTALSPAEGGTYVYTLTASKEGCGTQTDTVVVQVDDSLPGCDFMVTPTASNNAPGCSSPVSLSAGCSGGDCGDLSFQWTGPGVSQTGQTIDIVSPSGTGSHIYSVKATKSGCPAKTSSFTLNINNCDPPVGGDFNICLEAENQNGNGPVTGDPNASNGSTRGDQNNYNHYVDYAINGVKTTGNHLVKVRYYASGAAQASISVNGNTAIPTANFPATSSWNIVWREETFHVMLNQGNNMLRIQGLPGNSIRQDQICVTGPGGGQPACAFNIAPASNAPVYDINKPMTFAANCTGGDCAGVTYAWTGNGINASGETVSLTSPSTTGQYTYYVTAFKPGCPDKTSSVTIVVDWGVAPCRFYFFPELVSYNVSCSKPVVLYARCLEYDCDNVAYTWNGPGLNQTTGQIVNLTTPGEIGSYVYTVTGSKPGCESKTVEYTLKINSCPPPANEEFAVCMDAETQDGSGPVTSDPNASGGATRGDENNYKHYVNYAINGVPADGMYQLSLQYAASSSPKVSISGNDGAIFYAITIPATNSWNIVFREEIFRIPLKAGNNVLRIEGAPGASIRQDRICINSLHSNARLGAAEQSLQSFEQKSNLNVFPNPAAGEFTASFNIQENDARITVTDVRGRVWYDTKVKGKGPHDKKIKLGNAPAGIYIMQFKNGKTTDRKKVLIAH